MATTIEDLIAQRPVNPESKRRAQKLIKYQQAGYTLAELRKSQSLSQAQLAERIGVSQRQVSKIERGDLDNAKVTTLRKYVEALGADFAITATLDGKEFRLA